MSDTTGIEWTDHTFNPWWGCSRVSPACRFCYADRDASRYGFEVWRRHGPRRMLSDANWQRPVKWNRDAQRAGKPAKVFCASMADVFEDHPDVAEPRKRLWGVIEATPWLRWQLLTKRPENVASMAPWGNDWPSWVWLGTSVENQRYADERIPVLAANPARVLFLSCEPLLGPVNLRPYLMPETGHCTCGAGPMCFEGCPHEPYCGLEPPMVSWVIAGGESGPRARPMHPAWPERVRDDCRAAGVPFLFKQWGEWSPLAPTDSEGRFRWDGAHPVANDGTVYKPGDLAYPDGPRYGEAIRADHGRAQLTNMYRVGKKRAGRELDGRTWDEYPQQATVSAA